MRRLLAALVPLILAATPVAAQDAHAGHGQPATPPVDPHAGHATAAPQEPDPHAGHDMGSPPADDPHAGRTAVSDPVVAPLRATMKARAKPRRLANPTSRTTTSHSSHSTRTGNLVPPPGQPRKGFRAVTRITGPYSGLTEP